MSVTGKAKEKAYDYRGIYQALVGRFTEALEIDENGDFPRLSITRFAQLVASDDGDQQGLSAESLSGAIWRILIIDALINTDEEFAVDAFVAGVSRLSRGDDSFAITAKLCDPYSFHQIAGMIRNGKPVEHFDEALTRASTFCRIESRGITELVGRSDDGQSELLDIAFTLTELASELRLCANLERAGQLL
ncbi:MAG: hypothetical protein RLZ72_345 [Actinomycetota bacterium]|jgi:hypothetical protein